MAEAVQRALDNLRFDRMVKAFCVISPDNIIYQSTLDPEVEDMVKQTVSLYQGKISQLTVNTDQGLVVISKIKEDWLLAVLFPENLSLGIAVVKTKATLLALRELNIDIIPTIPTPTPVTQPPAPTPTPEPEPTPPLPEPTIPSPSDAQPSLETEPALEPPPPTPEPAAPTPPPTPEPTPSPAPVEPAPSIAPPVIPSTKSRIGLAFIPHGGETLLAALDKGSPVGSRLFEKFGPYARDVLFLVDGKRDVKTIAFLLGLPEYAVVEVLEFGINHKILVKAA